MKRQQSAVAIAITVSATVTLAPILRAQEPARITLGTVSLAPGMTEADARAALAECCAISPGGFVTTKNGPPLSLLGVVIFSRGRLIEAQRDWDERLDQEGSADVIRRLIDVVGAATCSANVVVDAQPTLRRNALVFTCSPNRT